MAATASSWMANPFFLLSADQLSPFLHQHIRKLPSWASLIPCFRSPWRRDVGHKSTPQERGLRVRPLSSLLWWRAEMGSFTSVAARDPPSYVWGRFWRMDTGRCPKRVGHIPRSIETASQCRSAGGMIIPTPTIPGGKTWPGRILPHFVCLLFNQGTVATLHIVKYSNLKHPTRQIFIYVLLTPQIKI